MLAFICIYTDAMYICKYVYLHVYIQYCIQIYVCCTILIYSLFNACIYLCI